MKNSQPKRRGSEGGKDEIEGGRRQARGITVESRGGDGKKSYGIGGNAARRRDVR